MCILLYVALYLLDSVWRVYAFICVSHQVREWQTKLRKEGRQLDRQILGSYCLCCVSNILYPFDFHYIVSIQPLAVISNKPFMYINWELIWCLYGHLCKFTYELKQLRIIKSHMSFDCFYRAMHYSAKRGIAIACRPSVCPSVRLSVRL